jgi:hypothetical protein
MRTEPLSREIQSGFDEPPTDIQLLMHGAWLVAGIAISLAACTTADESVHAAPVGANQNVARAAPQASATSGNVQDLTY